MLHYNTKSISFHQNNNIKTQMGILSSTTYIIRFMPPFYEVGLT